MPPRAEITHYKPTTIRIRSIHTMTPSNVQRLTDAGTGWHSRPYIARFVEDSASTTQQFQQFEAQKAAGTLIIPSVESRRGIAEVDEIIEIPGLRAFGIAMTDIAIALGHPMDYDHPDVWNFVDRVARKAKDRGIVRDALAR
jgi:2-keto-3-deoxy-L-rhamnonate aldolase RhmA